MLPEETFSATGVAARDRGRGTEYEYETIWTSGRPTNPPGARLVVRSGAATIDELAGDAHRQEFAVAAPNPARLRLNTYYFPGWRVYVDGQEQPIDWSNPSGLIGFSVERGEHLVVARFGPTPARLIGGALSALGLTGVLLLAFWPAGRFALTTGRPRTRMAPACRGSSTEPI